MRSIWVTGIGALGATVAFVFAFAAPGLIDDDAYIFLRYADRLAGGEGLSFNPGEPSAGITSPLWVLLLALVHRLTGADLVLVAQALGACCFGATLAIMAWTVQAEGQRPSLAAMAGALAALSPVFVCQAVSGMEVGLNMLLLAAALATVGRRSVVAPVAAGLAFATRPDNLLLAPMMVIMKDRRVSLVRTLVIVSVSLLVLGLPWALYCYSVGGSPLPPTRAGKLLVFMPGWYGITDDEFANLPLLGRLAIGGRGLQRVASMFTEGQARSLLLWIVLLAFGIGKSGRRLLAPVGLFLVSAITYACFFPLVKLRYFVHFLPWLVPVALVGLERRLRPSLRQIVLLILLIVHAGLCVRALPRYRNWVACEGTKTLAGRWLAEHTPPDARLALEPIGAIGYYSRRYIVDLGGLLATDIWPVIRHGPEFDPVEMLAYLRTRQAGYLIDAIDGPWAGRLIAADPGSLHLQATIPGRPGCGMIGVYTLRR